MEEKKTKKPKKSKNVVDRQYQKMERSAKFWNKIDPANRFRHWYLGTASFTRNLFRVVAAKQTIIILLSILSILYIMAAFYTGRGEFVIRLDRPMANEGFVLSETQDFSDLLVTLRANSVEDATNITITDIAGDVMNVDGDHNGLNYVAYTFYLKNATDETRNYQYQLQLKASAKGAEKASWIMLYYNGRQNIYAMANQDGNPERQFSVTPFPFMDYATEKVIQTQLTKDNQGYITKEKLEDRKSVV